MQRFRGTSVSEGIARGEAFLFTSGEMRVREHRISEERTEQELERLQRALDATRRDIRQLESQARERLGEMIEVIRTYQAFLDDEVGLLKPIRSLIRDEHWSAPSAVTRRFAELVEEFRSLPEPLPSRVPDLLDLERRIVGHLLGHRGGAHLDRLPRRAIIVADDLTPTQTASLDRSRVLAIATDRGGPASHTAILARHLGIPAVVGLGNITHSVAHGDQAIVDGFSGDLIIDPDERTVRKYATRQRRMQARARWLKRAEVSPRTRDGLEVEIMANLDTLEAAQEGRRMGLRGVGLFRTEYLYLGLEEAPDEGMQEEQYRMLLKDQAPNPVCIRTFDFGADKFSHAVGMPEEPNPFLGMRAIRLSFAYESVFRAQIRAILRASTAGNCRIMLPMVSDVAEYRKARAMILEEMDRLLADGVDFNHEVKIGAMVETPSAALTAGHLAREAHFLSIGTNDLTQYTLAVDRTNPFVAGMFQPGHPSVLRLIHETVRAAEEAGIPVTACGEMAGARRYVPVLLGLGLKTISMSPALVPGVVERISRLRLSSCREVAARMLEAGDSREAECLLDGFIQKLPRRTTRRAR